MRTALIPDPPSFGLKVDAPAIGQGIYEMICDAGQDDIVAVGMIPKPFMDLLESKLREKVVRLAAEQRQMTPEEFGPFVDKAKLEEIVRSVSHRVAIEI